MMSRLITACLYQKIIMPFMSKALGIYINTHIELTKMLLFIDNFNSNSNTVNDFIDFYIESSVCFSLSQHVWAWCAIFNLFESAFHYR